MNYIYWIKRKNHADPDNEGYVGFTNDPIRRFEEHKKKNQRQKVQNSIRKYDEIKSTNPEAWKEYCKKNGLSIGHNSYDCLA